ncbi:MAG: twin-arginine translocase TatA/TatE family subunit [Myxococcota bacterium]
MFGIGTGEFIIIALVLLFAVGPDKMPVFFKTVGKGLRMFRKTTRELKNSIGLDELMRDDDLRQLSSLHSRPKTDPNYVITPNDVLKEYPEIGADLHHATLQSSDEGDDDDVTTDSPSLPAAKLEAAEAR